VVAPDFVGVAADPDGAGLVPAAVFETLGKLARHGHGDHAAAGSSRMSRAHAGRVPMPSPEQALADAGG
jgi:hypothetical protein